jgi:hypothetical protein
MRARHNSFFVRAGFASLVSVTLACSDSVGPPPTAAELTVRTDSAVVHVRQTTPTGYWVDVPYTVLNASGQTLFYNAYCTTRWEKQDGASWVPVGEMPCHNFMFRSIVPYSSQNFGVGKGVGGPNIAVPDFAMPGTYRLVLHLYLDSQGTKPLPDDVTTSNTFQVMN